MRTPSTFSIPSAIAPITVLLLVCGGCSSDRTDVPAAPANAPVMQGISFPDWIHDASPDGTIGAARSCPRYPGQSWNLQLERAVQRSRAELSRILQGRITALLNDYEDNAGQVGREGALGHGNQVGLAVSRTATVNVDISNSRQKAIWEHPTTGDLHAWVVLTPGAIDQLASKARQEITISLKDRVAHMAASEAAAKVQAKLDRLEANAEAEQRRIRDALAAKPTAEELAKAAAASP